jgi:dipicolinate synthase subunit A
MYENIKLGMLGGDMRQLALVKRLASYGFEVAVWGLGNSAADIGEAVRCNDMDAVIRGSDAIILPLPASSDGVTVNCPLSSSQLRLTEVLELAEVNTVILGGKLSPSFLSAARKKGITCLDYFECEELQIKNALPTAEGAIGVAIKELPITIAGSKAAVVGFGRVGKAMAKTLVALGSEVTVAARSGEDLAWAELYGCKKLKLSSPSVLSELSGCDVIINTVPACLLDKNVLCSYPSEMLIIDLASNPGGVDFKAAKELGIKTIHALSLPGKTAPSTAGNIVCDCIIELLDKEGVLYKK